MLCQRSGGEHFPSCLPLGQVVVHPEPRTQRRAGDLHGRLSLIRLGDEHACQRIDAITDASGEPNPGQQSLGRDVAAPGIDSIEGGVDVGERLAGRHEQHLRFHASILSRPAE